MTEVVLFEAYVAEVPYGNLRYIEALFRRWPEEEARPLLLVPGAVGGALTNVAEQVPVPSALRGFGGSALPRRPLEVGRTITALVSYTVVLTRRLRREQTRVVQLHNLRGVLLAGVAARLAGAKVLWYVKGHLDNPILDRLAFLVAHRVAFQNERSLRRRYPRLVRRARRKLRIVPNGIDLIELDERTGEDSRAAARREMGGPHPTVVYLGQLTPAKGVEHLLIATGLQTTATDLYLVGDAGVAEYEAFAAALRGRYRDSATIHFLGYRADALCLLAEADLFVMPSLSEGVPRSVLEAMALGVPVVATDVGGIAEVVIDGETGLIVPPEDPVALADAIDALVRDADLRHRLGEAGRVRVRREHRIERNIEALRAVHAELIGRP